MEKVSIIVVVHNALKYCRILLNSISCTQDVEYEIVVVDNNSGLPTKLYLGANSLLRKIDRLCYLDRNTLFSEGNNIGVNISSRDSSLVLLLNSDIEIRDPLWLRKLLNIHQKGATAYGYVERLWPRADGYCFLIDRELYLRYLLDENFQWWWSITKLQADLLRDGFAVQAIKEHNDLLYHYGGKSGKAYQGAKGMGLGKDIIYDWYNGNIVTILETIE